MSERPDIKPRDWIRVGNANCVVAVVREAGNPLGDCEVVLTPDKPANLDVKWNGNDWEFIKTGDFGGYADRYERLSEFVHLLKRGKYS